MAAIQTTLDRCSKQVLGYNARTFLSTGAHTRADMPYQDTFVRKSKKNTNNNSQSTKKLFTAFKHTLATAAAIFSLKFLVKGGKKIGNFFKTLSFVKKG